MKKILEEEKKQTTCNFQTSLRIPNQMRILFY